MGDLKVEGMAIERILRAHGIRVKVEIVEYLSQALDGSFDVMFFDWGGMCIGNSILESSCEHILEDAHEHPSRDYVMTSDMTEFAMKDAIKMSEGNLLGKPTNLFLTPQEYCNHKSKLKENKP